MTNFRKFCWIFLVVGIFAKPCYANFINAETDDIWDASSNEPAVKTIDIQNTKVDYLKVKPVATLWALAGKEQVAKLQGLWPFAGDGLESVYYAAAEGAGSTKTDNGYSAGLAFGMRKIFDNSYYLGGYLFADYNRTPDKHTALVINPGFEAIGYAWDFRANAYLPVSKRNWSDTPTVAESIGINEYEKYTGHTKSDHLLRQYEEIGPGFDAEVGALIPIPKLDGLRAYVGGYHYIMSKTDSVTGASARISYPLTKNFALEVRDTYDKPRKNTIMGGIKFSFGGYSEEERASLGVVGRLTDPIERNFANINNGNTILTQKKLIDAGLYNYPGLYYFWRNGEGPAANAAGGDGTFENPFTDLDLLSYNRMMDETKSSGQSVSLYFATPGTFNMFDMDRMVLPLHYSVYGRTADFMERASYHLQPTLLGGIDLTGDNTIDDVLLKNENKNFGTKGALYINSPYAVTINDVRIHVSEDLHDAYGISINNNPNLTLNNLEVLVSGGKAVGINSIGSHLTFFTPNIINAVATDGNATAINSINSQLAFNSGNNKFHVEAINGVATGVLLDGSTLKLLQANNDIAVIGHGGNAIVFDVKPNSYLDIVAPTASGSKGGNSFLSRLGFGDLTLNNQQSFAYNTFSAYATGSANNLEAYGIRVVDGQHTVTIANIMNSIFNIGQGSDSNLFKAYGISAVNANIGTVANDIFNIDTKFAVAGNYLAGIDIQSTTGQSTLDRVDNTVFNIGEQNLGSRNQTLVAKSLGILTANVVVGTIANSQFNVDATQTDSNAIGFAEYGTSTVSNVLDSTFHIGLAGQTAPTGHGDAHYAYGFFSDTNNSAEVVNFSRNNFVVDTHNVANGIVYYSSTASQPLSATINLDNNNMDIFGVAVGSGISVNAPAANNLIIHLQDNNNINVHGSGANYGISLAAPNSALNINGVSNTIAASSSGANNAYGINLVGATFTMNGNGNTITANTNTGYAYGIAADHSHVLISNGSNTINATATAGSATAINLVNNSSLTITPPITSGGSGSHGLMNLISLDGLEITGAASPNQVNAFAPNSAIGINAVNSLIPFVRDTIFNVGQAGVTNSATGVKINGMPTTGNIASFDALDVINVNGNTSLGMYFDAAGNTLKLNGLTLNSTSNGANQNYGVELKNGTTTLESNNQFTIKGNNESVFGIIAELPTSVLNINGSNNVINSFNTGSAANNAYGIWNYGTTTFTGSSSNNSVSAHTRSGLVAGIENSNATLTINGNNNNIYAHDDSGTSSGNMLGVNTYGTNSNFVFSGTGNKIIVDNNKNVYGINNPGSGIIKISGSNNLVQVTSTGGGVAAAINSNTPVEISGSNNNFTATNNGADHAYSVYSTNNFTIDAGANNNVFNAIANAGAWAGAYFPASSNNILVNINGNNNKFFSQSATGNAVGIETTGTASYLTTINLNGNSNIIEADELAQSASGSVAFGVDLAGYSALNFGSSAANNQIIAKSIGNNAISEIDGIRALTNSNVVIAGTGNTISAFSNGAANAYGINTLNGDVLISGSGNNISVTGNAGNIYGISVGSNLTISGSNNTITVAGNATDSLGNLTGVVMQNGKIFNFGRDASGTVTGSGNTINVSGTAPQDVIGVKLSGNNVFNIAGTSNNINSNAASASIAIGIDGGNIGSNTLEIDGSKNRISAVNTHSARGIDFWSAANSNIIITESDDSSQAHNTIFASSAASGASGIELYNSNLTFSNTASFINIIAISASNSASSYGIVNLGGATNIGGNGNNVISVSGGDPTGIYIDGGTLNITSANNQIIATSSGSESIGLSLHDGSSANITGSNNLILANGGNTFTRGVDIYNGTMTISGSDNTITANSSSAKVSGVYMAGADNAATFNSSGVNLVINAINTNVAGPSATYGITNADYHNINLYLSNATINTKSSGGALSTEYGINFGGSAGSNLHIVKNVINVGQDSAYAKPNVGYGIWAGSIQANRDSCILSDNATPNIINVNAIHPEQSWGVYINPHGNFNQGYVISGNHFGGDINGTGPADRRVSPDHG